MKKLLRSLPISLSIALTITLLCTISATAEPDVTNLLPNAGFENPPATVGKLTLPAGWNSYQYGPDGSKYLCSSEAGAGRNGSTALRAENIDPQAKAGVYTHIPLNPGSYELSVWARAPKGETAHIRIYLANAYSRTYSSQQFIVDDQWKQFFFYNSIPQAIKSAEINMQNVSDRAGVVWFDDVALHSVNYAPAKDTRAEHPRTLMFGAMNVNYLHDTAAEWAKHGFRGFLFEDVMRSWDNDVWASDGDAKTRDADDKLLQEVLSCDQACRKVGIDSNFIKVALYTGLPDPFDDAAWQKITENFRQCARFASMSKCVGIALDTEYISEQYNPAWHGYAKNPHPLPVLKAKIYQRWHDITAAMLQEYPQMVLLTLPEGIMNYDELYKDLFNGMLDAMAQANAPGGMHVMTEGTYHYTNIDELANYTQNLQDEIQEKITPATLPYWKSHCSVALGAWPLGYYRAINDEDGKFLGWSGRKEIFGDKIVGSYADKSAWYTPQVFADQMAGLNSFSPRYNWIYAHGDVFWQWTPEQKTHYESMAHKSIFNVLLPVVSNLQQYFQVIAHPGFVKQEKINALTAHPD
jgi:hypothetical protein